ncbi:MAG: peptide chain release factor 2 [Clostridiales bacterium]|nr:MAG: peptide chain release factor 2 [Clostridiales bacterium]
MEKDITELGIHFNLSAVECEIEELEKVSFEPGFYEDMDKAGKILQKIKLLKNKVQGFNDIKNQWEDVSTLVELGIEENDDSVLGEVKTGYCELQEKIDNMKLDTLLSGKYDKLSAIITLHSGAGGTEAQDWCEMLYRMYNMWAERKGFKTEVIDYLDGEEAGIKSVTFSIEGLNAYGYIKSEKGVHRLVRISPFDSAARRHTSFASCEVIPELDEELDVEINPEDLRIDTYRSSGAGGQHINKTESAIRITHLPTGIVVTCQNERSQHKNKETAMKVLKSKLVEIAEREQKDKIDDLKGVQTEIAWGNQIRSYVFHPYSMVKDHRTNYETGNINAVMNGDIDGFINAYLKAKSKGEI